MEGKKLTELQKTLIKFLSQLRIGKDIIKAVVIMAKTEENITEMIHFLPEISVKTYTEDIGTAESLILLKAMSLNPPEGIIQKTKIVKLQLRSDNLCFGPAPKQDEECEQRLTLTAKGRVWFSRYCFGDNGKYEKKEVRRWRINTDDAEFMLNDVDDYFFDRELKMDSLFETDAGTWKLTLTDDLGVRYHFNGSTACLDDRLSEIAEKFRIKLGISDLYMFDGMEH